FSPPIPPQHTAIAFGGISETSDLYTRRDLNNIGRVNVYRNIGRVNVYRCEHTRGPRADAMPYDNNESRIYILIVRQRVYDRVPIRFDTEPIRRRQPCQ